MISFLYSIAIIVIIAAYFPQIYCLLKARTRCSDISLTTWFMWESTNFITLLYAIYEINDPKLIFLNTAYCICAGVIIGITIYKRKKYAGIEV